MAYPPFFILIVFIDMKNVVDILKFIGEKFPEYSFEKYYKVFLGGLEPVDESSTIDDDLKKNGVWADYWGNGKLRYKVNFKDGKSNGLIEFYDSNGTVSLRGSMVNGKREGEFRKYDNGKLIDKTMWENGKPAEKTSKKPPKLNEEIERINYLFSHIRGTVISENELSLLDKVKEKYVGDDKLLTEDEFNKIMESTNGKVQYVIWMIKKISENIIPKQDIKLYNQYFDIFNKNKKKFKYQDIHGYKTESDLIEWISTVKDILDKQNISYDMDGKKSFVSSSDIDKLKEVGINYLGKVKDYQIFHMPKNVSNDDLAFKRYKDILGKCSNREFGEIVHFCTLVQNTFKGYLEYGPLFIIYNLSDELSPYQFSYEGKQFKNRKNENIF